jgi:hypothetical protein
MVFMFLSLFRNSGSRSVTKVRTSSGNPHHSGRNYMGYNKSMSLETIDQKTGYPREVDEVYRRIALIPDEKDAEVIENFRNNIMKEERFRLKFDGLPKDDQILFAALGSFTPEERATLREVMKHDYAGLHDLRTKLGTFTIYIGE